jgi:DNA polymerase III subunit epsilon
LDRVGRAPLRADRIIDTLALARRRHPAGPNSLDALCKRYGIDTSERTKHGALVDSLLLASVYVELLGERQATLGLGSQTQAANAVQARSRAAAKQRPAPLPVRLTAEAEAAHREFIKSLGPDALWLRYLAVPQS